LAGRLKSESLVDMLFDFGISKAEYNSVMSQADNFSQASNYFEGIKIQVSIAWETMKDRIKPNQRARLQASHDRIQTLKLKNWTKPPKVPEQQGAQIQSSIERIIDGKGSEEDYKLARFALGMNAIG